MTDNNAAIKPVNQWVDAVFVLSVKTFHQRIAHIKQQMAKHHIAFEFIFEHDIDSFQPELLAARFDPSKPLPKAAQSLVLKHIAAWERTVENRYSRVLVLEDDAVLSDDFVEKFDQLMHAVNQLSQAWLVTLGGMSARVSDSYLLQKQPLVALPIGTTEAYVFNHPSAERRMAWLATHKIQQPADHLMQKIEHEAGIQNYWMRHPIVEQGSLQGLFHSSLHQGKAKNIWFERQHYRWNLFRRRKIYLWRALCKQALGLPLRQ